MLRLEIAKQELFDEATNTFIAIEPRIVELEHSLLAVSLWEAKYQKPFLDSGKSDRTFEETTFYIKSMMLDQSGDTDFIEYLNQSQLREISAYIESKESATTFSTFSEQRGRSSEIVTSELIYYWMVAYQIPFECERWNLNRLFALIRICGIKNNPNQKKMPKHAIAARNRELNNARRAQMGTSG